MGNILWYPSSSAAYQQVIIPQIIATSWIIDFWLPTPNYLIDVSGNASSLIGIKGLNWTQANATFRPQINNFENIPCLTFNGTNQLLTLGSSALLNNVSGFTAGFASRLNVNPTTNRPIFYASTNVNTSIRFSDDFGRTSGIVGAAFRRLDTDTTRTISAGSTSTNPIIKVVRADYLTNTGDINVNGTSFGGTVSSSGGGNTSATNSVVINLGAAISTYFSGNLFAGFIANKYLTNSETDIMSGILAWTTNNQSRLISAHPFANYPPYLF
jgi:hypothetical protein